MAARVIGDEAADIATKWRCIEVESLTAQIVRQGARAIAIQLEFNFFYFPPHSSEIASERARQIASFCFVCRLAMFKRSGVVASKPSHFRDSYGFPVPPVIVIITSKICPAAAAARHTPRHATTTHQRRRALEQQSPACAMGCVISVPNPPHTLLLLPSSLPSKPRSCSFCIMASDYWAEACKHAATKPLPTLLQAVHAS